MAVKSDRMESVENQLNTNLTDDYSKERRYMQTGRGLEKISSLDKRQQCENQVALHQELFFDILNDDTHPLAEGRKTPKIATDLLQGGILDIVSSTEIGYMGASVITTSEGEEYVCLTEDITEGKVLPSNILVTKKDIFQDKSKRYIDKALGTPIKYLKDCDARVSYDDLDFDDNMSRSSTSVSFGDKSMSDLFAPEDICKLGHLHIGKTPPHSFRP